MKKSIQLVGIFLFFIMIIVANPAAAAVTFKPAPYQDQINGRNSNTYNPAVNHPTSAEKVEFINEVKDYAITASKIWGVPASVITAMAAVESGYGFTQIAYYANNLFGVKAWGVNPANAWQLKGQPDEMGGGVKVAANYGYDRKIYEESARQDNWYRAFANRREAVNYLVGTFLMKDRYRFARDNYQQRIRSGWSAADAAKQYCYEIAQAGYNHLGGEYYKKKIGKVMDEWNLYKYDVVKEKK